LHHDGGLPSADRPAVDQPGHRDVDLLAGDAVTEEDSDRRRRREDSGRGFGSNCRLQERATIDLGLVAKLL
jgi:hypothetical protein